MKFLFFGLGSIGQRHVRTLRRLLGDKVEISAFRQRGLPIVVNDDLTAVHGVAPEEHYRITVHASLDRALDQELTAVYVTNPIAMHVPTAIRAAEAGHNLFIEKPLSSSREGLAELASLVERKRLVTMVGYQMRFHPALGRIRALLAEGAIGSVVSADVHFGEWLPGMHPYEDYRVSHAARRDQGGGVILCLSHEIDYATWMFGQPRRIASVGGRFSDLEIDVEDTADILLECEDSFGRTVPVHVHLDFLARPPRRYCRVLGDRGTLHWDYYANVLHVWRGGASEPETLTFPDFVRNDMFVSETTSFLNAVRAGCASDIPLEEGLRTLEVCLRAREAMADGAQMAT